MWSEAEARVVSERITKLQVELVLAINRQGIKPSLELAVALVVVGVSMHKTMDFPIGDLKKAANEMIDLLYAESTEGLSGDELITRAKAIGATSEELADLLKTTANFDDEEVH